MAPQEGMTHTVCVEEVTQIKKQQPPPENKEKPYQPRLVWKNIAFLSAFHGLTLWGLVTLQCPLSLWVAMHAYGYIGGWGVTAGVHRLWSHRAYKAKTPLRILLALAYSVSCQNTILEWVRDHRVHHKFTETDADPHNAKRGFFFAHCGWLMQRKHPEVLRQGKKVDMSDVEADPVVQWHERFFFPLQILLGYLVPMVFVRYVYGYTWAIAFVTVIMRIVFTVNYTWLVNSAAHMYGTKPYDTRINPTENWLVSLVSFGEGWHNYHHIFPWDYKASEHSYFLNPTTLILDMFAKIGWAYDLKTATPEMVRRVAEKHGDGSLLVHDQHEEVSYEEYIREAERNDIITGVTKLTNEQDLTRRFECAR